MEFENLAPLAPGISTKIKVIFLTSEISNFHDEIVILSNDYQYTLELHAFKDQTDLKWESLVNLGFVELSKPSQRAIPFFNESNVRAQVMLKYDEKASPEISFDHTNFSVPENSA